MPWKRTTFSGLAGYRAACPETLVTVRQVTCGGGNGTLPAERDGGYCFQASAGDHAGAYFSPGEAHTPS